VLGRFFGTIAIPIRLNALSAPHRIPVAETLSLVCAILLGYLTRPRLWQWERLGGRRVGIVTAVTALCVIAVSALPPLATLSTLPADFRWSWLAANALILAAVSQTAAALAGPLLGGGITMILYFTYAVIDNLAPQATPYLGLTPYSNAVLPTFPDQSGPPAHWLLALALTLAALAVHGYTHGSTSWAQRRTNNEN
jgi:hypothetical protein